MDTQIVSLGLKKTSLVMDQEHPRGEHSINNRNELRKVLHLEMLYKENKVKKNPLKTSLEIITSYFLDHFGKNTYSLIQETPLSIVSASKMNNKLPLKCSENSAVNNNHTCELSDEDGKNRYLLPLVLDTSRISCSWKAIFSSLESVQMAEPLELKRMSDFRLKAGLFARGSLSGPIVTEVRAGGQDLGRDGGRRPPFRGPLILMNHFLLFKEIKTLLFGSNLCGFNEEWKVQNFTFSEVSQLRYGLVQNKGGPCGVLAAVQGCVLKNLLFGGESRTTSIRASGMQQFSPAGSYKADGVLEMLVLHKVAKYDDLLVFLQQNIHQFQTGPSGCILLTLSAVLSRSTDQVRKDFDMPTNCLIGAHGYCTQELVNLLLTGKAVSNVFNDMVELDSGNGNITLLKGITSRSDIGLLSLFEHYDVCQVGCYLKTPRYPIWVVCSESHFSILFSLQRDLLNDWKVERIFDLYYYDGLANQQKEIRLTVDTTQPGPGEKEKDLIPPLEHCIRTK
uniref:Ubiquitin carboxyl-terminal hydrolase MINDY n=1 Tax=Monodelphis domestica TaxID=13616 RepID=A0A5F8H6Y3_MONDO